MSYDTRAWTGREASHRWTFYLRPFSRRRSDRVVAAAYSRRPYSLVPGERSSVWGFMWGYDLASDERCLMLMWGMRELRLFRTPLRELMA